MPPSPVAEPSLSIETPERVELSLDVAGLGTRALAWMIDALILFLLWVTGAFVFTLFQIVVSLEDLQALSTLAQVGLAFGAFLLQWGYWVISETAGRGRSPGKRALRIRVVRVDGGPAGFFEAALRNLARVVDFLPALYALGMVSMTVDRRGRRLGDLLAGTVVVRERHVSLDRYAEAEPRSAGATGELSPAEFELVSGFLERAAAIEPEARARVAAKIAGPLAGRLAAAEQARLVADGAAAEAWLRRLVGRDG